MWCPNKIFSNSVCNVKNIFTEIINNQLVELRRLIIFKQQSITKKFTEPWQERRLRNKYYMKKSLYFTQLSSRICPLVILKKPVYIQYVKHYELQSGCVSCLK